MKETDCIQLQKAPTLAAAFRERVQRSPNKVAYIQYQEPSKSWHEYTWAETAHEVCRWQDALRGENLAAGDRVAIMLRNCREWVIFDQAALGLGLVTVPLYTNDRPENIGYILQNAGVRLLLTEDASDLLTASVLQDQLAALKRILCFKAPPEHRLGSIVTTLEDWLPAAPQQELETAPAADPHGLATIIYTSGTTGRPKGVMLSHDNILRNASACLELIDIFPDDLMLSFLPMSHSLERNLGYYLPILAGSQVAYARSVPQLAEDLVQVRPTILIAVPRIFERIYQRITQKLKEDKAIVRKLFYKTVSVGLRRFEIQQKRAAWKPALLLWPLLEKLVASKVQQRLGGRLRFAVSGGAPLAPEIAQFFIGLGVPIQQGYGLTETSPVVSANPLEDNVPASVGRPVAGVEVKIGRQDELLTRGSSVMLGYWNDPAATKKVIESDGWFHTGDQARIENDHIYITGRLKEVIVLANGEKVPPADMEMAIAMDDIFDQVLVVGEGRPFLVALIVPNPELFSSLASELGLDPEDDSTLSDPALERALLERIQTRLHAFPGYAEIRRVGVVRQPWDIDDGLMTPTMKLRRSRIIENYHQLLEQLYLGH